MRLRWLAAGALHDYLILECLVGGMSLEEINNSFDSAFPPEALPEVLKVASELADSFHVAA
jgi:hypothetical protein